MGDVSLDGGYCTIGRIISFEHMKATKIRKELEKTERLIAKESNQRQLLWRMILPYMSEEFQDEQEATVLLLYSKRGLILSEIIR